MSGKSGTLAFMSQPGTVELRQYDLPALDPGAILLRTRLAGVCGSEVHMYSGRHSVLKSVVLGHEMVGEVAEVGSAVQRDRAGQPLHQGDRVTVTYFQTCMSCAQCGRGMFHHCERGYEHWLGSPDEAPHFIGMMSTHYHVRPTQWVYRVPDSVTDVEAVSVNCALAQVLYGIDCAEVQAGQTVVVSGAGGLGLYATALATERGARVVVLDPSLGRLERAKAFGAFQSIQIDLAASREERTSAVKREIGLPVDVVVDLAGSPDAMLDGLALLRTGGIVVEMGNVLPGVEAGLDVGELTRRNHSIRTVIRYPPWYLLRALEFIVRCRERFPLGELVDRVYSLTEVVDALEDSKSRTVTRAAIKPSLETMMEEK